jgi:predicted RNA-binding protein YlxR (DUF448 family)
MTQKKEPVRMCVVCRAGKPKEALIRIVKTKQGEIAPDISGKADGRGAYICREERCIDAARKKRALQRAFRCDVEECVYDSLRQMIQNGE